MGLSFLYPLMELSFLSFFQSSHSFFLSLFLSLHSLYSTLQCLSLSIEYLQVKVNFQLVHSHFLSLYLSSYIFCSLISSSIYLDHHIQYHQFCISLFIHRIEGGFTVVLLTLPLFQSCFLPSLFSFSL